MTHVISPKLNSRQTGVIVGTIMGGSSLIRPSNGKNCYLSMRCKNAKWLEFKSTELTLLSSDAPFTIEKTYRWHSLCYPIFNEFEERFYKDKTRRLTSDELDLLSDISFAVWFGDSARYIKENIVFNTHVWGKSGTELICDYFNLLEYEPEIFSNRDCFRIKLSKFGSMEFMKIAGPHLPHWYFSKSKKMV